MRMRPPWEGKPGRRWSGRLEGKRPVITCARTFACRRASATSSRQLIHERGEVMSVRHVPRRTRGIFALLLVVAACAVAVAATGGAATAADSTKSYIVLMGASPAIAYEGGVAGIPATKPGKGKKINPYAENVKQYRGHLQA